MKLKRSGRTILVVTLGVLTYTLFMAWYDGQPLTPARLQELSGEQIPPAFQPGLERLKRDQYTGDIFLIKPVTETDRFIQSWSRASHSDPLVLLQLRSTLSQTYPGNPFRALRYRNLASFVEDLEADPVDPVTLRQAILIQGDRYWLKLKFLLSWILGGILVVLVCRLDRSKPVKP